MLHSHAANQMARGRQPAYKKLVICLDGTWNEPEECSESGKIKEELTNAREALEARHPIDHSKGTARRYASQNLARALEDGRPTWQKHQAGRVWDYESEAIDMPT